MKLIVLLFLCEHHINVLCFFHRLLKMQPGKTVKSVFDTLYNLTNQGFQTWISKAYELSWSYDPCWYQNQTMLIKESQSVVDAI